LQPNKWTERVSKLLMKNRKWRILYKNKPHKKFFFK
jgi:hypothetical protein